jgi:hypothetical protein
METNQLLYDYHQVLWLIHGNRDHLKTERNTDHRTSLERTIGHLEAVAEIYREQIRAAGLDPYMNYSDAVHLMEGAIVRGANVRTVPSAAELLYRSRQGRGQ